MNSYKPARIYIFASLCFYLYTFTVGRILCPFRCVWVSQVTDCILYHIVHLPDYSTGVSSWLAVHSAVTSQEPAASPAITVAL